MVATAFATDMGYFEPQERRTQSLNVRVPKTVSDGLRDLARLWTHMEQVRTGDSEAEVTVSDVAVRLLTIGLEGAWGEVGMRPQTQEQWAQAFKSAEKALDPSKKK